ncbi:MAG: GMP synthase, partial [Candidatus Ratteibacteria bacterium]
KQIEEYFRKKYNIELQRWDKQNEFISALKGIVSPEEKRTTFRDVFYRIMSQAMRSYAADVLVQGTILSDIIETQKGIKTHFNVLHEAGINPANYGLNLFEPLKELTKSRV